MLILPIRHGDVSIAILVYQRGHIFFSQENDGEGLLVSDVVWLALWYMGLPMGPAHGCP